MQYWCRLRLWALVVGLSVVGGTARIAQAQPTFGLSFDAPATVEGIAGGTVGIEATGLLSSADNAEADGAQAWQISMRVVGCDLLDATTSGTAGALDNDGGLRDSTGKIGSFEKTEIINPDLNFGKTGAVSAVILSFEGVGGVAVTLPPNGTEPIVRLSLEANVPQPVDGVCQPTICSLSYEDGLRGSGEPISNRITYRGENVIPSLGVSNIEVCAFQGDFAFGFDAPGTFQGLAGSVAQVEVSATLTSGKLPTEPGAQGWQAGFTADGCTILNVTTDGTAVDTYSNPEGNSFKDTQLLDLVVPFGEPDAVISAVVLDFDSVLTLPPQGTADILRFTLENEIPQPVNGFCDPNPCVLSYVDGLQGSGAPIDNLVTFAGANVRPSLGTSVVNFCPFAGDFRLGFDAPALVEGTAGGSVDFEAVGTLSSTNLPTDRGAQGWQIGISVDGWELTGATLDGTAADTTTNGGYSNPEGNSFQDTELLDLVVPFGENDSVASAVILDFDSVFTLPVDGSADLIRLSLSGDVPQPVDGVCQPNPCVLSYVNGINGLDNLITYEGASVAPVRGVHITDVCAFSGNFTLGFDVAGRLEGKAGSTFQFETAATLTSAKLPTGRGAQGWQIGVAAQGWTILNATTEGTTFDKFGNPEGNSFQDTELLEDGVVSAVLLDFDSVLTLPTDGTVSLLRLTVEGEVPVGAPAGVCDPNLCTLTYVDGLNGLDNLVTYEGANVRPNLTSSTTEICPFTGDFSLGFAVPDLAEGPAGGVVDVPVIATLTSADLPTANGAQGWQIGVGSLTCEITGATTDGTAADTTTNGGFSNPEGNAFKQTELVVIRDEFGIRRGSGVISAVVLDFDSALTLPPTGTADLLAITVAAEVPQPTPDGCDPNVCNLFYVDGLQGSGSVINNLITYEGSSVLPTLGEADFDVCAFSPEFALGFTGPSNVEGPLGGAAEFEIVGTLSSADIEGDEGAQAWQVGVSVGGCEVTAATTSGTAGAFDNDGGLRDSSGKISSFEKTEIVDPALNGGKNGAVSAVILSFESGITLPSNTTSDILRLTLSAPVPDPVNFRCEPNICTAMYMDGLRGGGEPVDNKVTFQGGNVIPSLGSKSVEICPPITPPTALRVTVGNGTTEDKGGDSATWTVQTSSAGPTDVEIDIVLDSMIEPCVSDPGACDGTENMTSVNPDTQEVVYGCDDGIDNDSDGLTDASDPDCRGVQGWSMSVATDECLSLSEATTVATVGDLDTRPPGRRDSEGGNFAKTELVDPANNGGQNGAVSAIVLSFTNPVILGQVGSETVLKISASIDASGVPAGGMTDPCGVRIIPPAELGLVGSGEPVKTAVTIAGETQVPTIVDADVKVMVAAEVEFVRCDPNNDGINNIADAIWLVNELFQSGPMTACQKAGDCNDDGMVDLSDATYAVDYQFRDGAAPPAPFPDCGVDPTPDDVTCDVIPTACR